LLLTAAVAVSTRGAAVSNEAALTMSREGVLNAAAVVLSVAAFIASVDLVGFLVAATFVLLVLLLRFGTHPLKAGLIALTAAGAVQLLFAGVLRVPLPRGLWFEG